MIISMGDLHIHTTCSDGSSTYELIVKRAMKLRYAFIAITDHHFADTALCRQVIESCRNEKRILCIPGMEVSGRVHMLAVGITKSVDKGLPVKAQVQAVHKQGGLAIAAHPYAIPPYSEDELFRSGLDAAECSAVPPMERTHFLEMQQKYPIHCVFNSDAHNIFQMQTFNICSGKITTFDDLKKAILENRCW
jgi:histidinol phosphatase-like PHP family hydrolase